MRICPCRSNKRFGISERLCNNHLVKTIGKCCDKSNKKEKDDLKKSICNVNHYFSEIVKE